MYDRETGSLWTQVTGEAVKGSMEGARLEEIPSVVTTWSRWKLEHPETLVLVRDPAIAQPEDYRAYENNDHMLGIFGTRNSDTRLGGKERILGVKPNTLGNAHPIAYPIDRLELIHDFINATPVVIARDPNDGSGRMFRRTAQGLELRFESERGRPDRATDVETGSAWNLLTGEATGGPLAGARLAPVPVVPAYWFAWIAFYPATEIGPVVKQE